MDSWIFQIARKICMVAFAADIFIHAVIGASAVNGLIKGAVSMGVMLVLLVILSSKDLDQRVKKSKRDRKKPTSRKIKDKGVGIDE